MDNVFLRSGIAALSDLKSNVWESTFADLDRQQIQFQQNEAKFRSSDYKWPRNALHNWSRVWEYPYAYLNILAALDTGILKSGSQVVDLGSGVTFFPFVVARKGLQVSCADIDPTNDTDLKKAIQVEPAAPGSVTSLLINGTNLPFKDESVDLLYCISVLEHIPQPWGLLGEIGRCVKKGGRIIITMDLAMDGMGEITVTNRLRLHEELAKNFRSCVPTLTVHPADMLTIYRGPFPMRKTWIRKKLSFIKNRVVKPMVGKKPGRHDIDSAVEGLVLEKI